MIKFISNTSNLQTITNYNQFLLNNLLKTYTTAFKPEK